MASSDKLRTNRVALNATLLCLTGCGIGEILNLAIGETLGAALGFFVGYTLTVKSMLRGGLTIWRAIALALATDAVSTTIMEALHAGITLTVAAAVHAGAHSPWFWTALSISLIGAAFAAYPINRWLVTHGQSHAPPSRSCNSVST